MRESLYVTALLMVSLSRINLSANETVSEKENETLRTTALRITQNILK